MNTPEINDGGPAFPCTTGSDGGVAFSGMSLRDWFAGQALTLAKEWRNVMSEDDLARNAYKIADAMLAQRNKK